MSGKFFLPVLVAIVGSAMVAVPWIQSAFRIFHIGRDFTLENPHLDKLMAETCSLMHPTKLTGCEDMMLIGNSIYTSCVTDMKNNHKWGRNPEENIAHISGDRLFRWDLDTDSVVELELRGMPGPKGAAGRSFLGLDVNEHADGTISFYIINLIPNGNVTGNVIEKFTHDPKTSFMTHKKRIPTTADGAARIPNGIFALPEHDDQSAMYVTNDHYYNHGPMRAFEMYARRPWSWVSFYSDSTGWKTVLPGMVGVNGITGDKNPKNRKIYASELGGGAIRVLKQSEKGAFGDVEQIQSIDIGMTGDNPTRYGDDLYITGVARGHLFAGWKKAPEGEKPLGIFEGGPGMILKRIPTKQLGSDFYGSGYTAAPVVEELIADGFGRMVNVSSTAIFRAYDAEKAPESADDEDAESPISGNPKGDLFITGIASRGIWKCKNFE